jgi:hypothetical protein
MAAKKSLIPLVRIEQAILMIRGHKVMLDADLAEIYGVGVGRLNEAVKRNLSRFPEDFLLQLTREEFKDLRSKTGASNLKSQIAISSSSWGGRRHPPYAFTAGRGHALQRAAEQAGRT